MSVDTPTRPMDPGHDNEPTNINYTGALPKHNGNLKDSGIRQNIDLTESWKDDKNERSKKKGRKIFAGVVASLVTVGGLAAGLVMANASNTHAVGPAKPSHGASAPVTPGPEVTRTPTATINQYLDKYDMAALSSKDSKERGDVLYQAHVATGSRISLFNTLPKGPNDLSDYALGELCVLVDEATTAKDNHALVTFGGNQDNGWLTSMVAYEYGETELKGGAPVGIRNNLALMSDSQGNPYARTVDAQTVDVAVTFTREGQSSINLALEFKYIEVAPGKYTPVLAYATEADQPSTTFDGSGNNYDPFKSLKALKQEMEPTPSGQ